jgi:hypothetical protein
MAIPNGIARRQVLDAIRDYEGGVSHRFGPSTRYDLVYGGRHYPPKAIVGLAARDLNGGAPLEPEDFSGGEGDSSANRVLRDLGFDVVLKDALNAATSGPGSDWSDDEIAVVTPAYFGLLHAQRRGENPVKADLRDPDLR